MTCLRRSLGVKLGGLEPGLDSASLKPSSAASSVFFTSRGGGVAVLLPTCSDLLSLVRFRGRAGFSLLCPPKVDESNCLPADGRSRGSVTDRHSVSLAPWGMHEAEQERRKRLLELMPLSSSAAARRLPVSVLDFFHMWGERKPELPGSRKAPLGTPAPLLAFGDLVGSAVSEARAGGPLQISLLSSSLAPLRSGWPSISRKELLRLGGVGAIFFFFLIKALNRLVFLSLGRRRSSSFRLPSGGPRSFRGSSGDTAGSLSSASETEGRMSNSAQQTLPLAGWASVGRLPRGFFTLGLHGTGSTESELLEGRRQNCGIPHSLALSAISCLTLSLSVEVQVSLPDPRGARAGTTLPSSLWSPSNASRMTTPRVRPAEGKMSAVPWGHDNQQL